MRLRRTLMAGAVSASYNTLVTAAAPNLWWKLEETSGTTAVDSGSAGKNGTINGGATFAGATINAPAGYAGLGKGADMGVGSFQDVRGDITGVKFGGSSTDSWTIVLVVAGGSGSGYIASRVNQAAVIYNFVAGQVEFFSSGGSGSDPRTGSQIALSTGDSTTPHQIVYRYDNGNWCGLKDGVEIFNVSRSFSLLTSTTTCYLGSDSSTSQADQRCWDFQVYNRAVSTVDLAAMWAARNT